MGYLQCFEEMNVLTVTGNDYDTYEYIQLCVMLRTPSLTHMYMYMYMYMYIIIWLTFEHLCILCLC